MLVHVCKYVDHADFKEVSRRRTRGESEESIAHRPQSKTSGGSTSALKPRADITRSRKEEY